MTEEGRWAPVLERAEAWAPATLSNLGPGFDVLGLAVEEWGERVQARISEMGEVRVGYSEESLWKGPSDPNENTAGVSAISVLEKLRWTGGVDLVISKQIIPGSGVGSSAASSVAAAWAVNLLFGAPLTKADVVDAVLEGEAVASGEYHGDNALPSLFGNILMVSSEKPQESRLIGDGRGLFLSVLLPDIQIMTSESRAILPGSVPIKSAVHNSSNLAFLVHALATANWKDAGRRIMSDRIVEPTRSRLIPCFQDVRASAVKEGAYGCALSGSGPAMFAMSDNVGNAGRILDAMKTAAGAAGVESMGIVTQVNTSGVRETELEKVDMQQLASNG